MNSPVRCSQFVVCSLFAMSREEKHSTLTVITIIAAFIFRTIVREEFLTRRDSSSSFFDLDICFDSCLLLSDKTAQALYKAL